MKLTRFQEIYVISNRDVKAMQTLDHWLNYIDTLEITPLFENNAKEYSVPRLTDVDWSRESELTVRLARDRDFSVLDIVDNEQSLSAVFLWILEKGEVGLLLEIYQRILDKVATNYPGYENGNRIQILLDFLTQAPLLSAKFARLPPWKDFSVGASEVLEKSSSQILKAYILCANDMQEFVVKPFRTVLSQIQRMSMDVFSELVELMSLTVHSPSIALEIIFECLEPESSRILPSGNPKMIQHFVRNLFGIALDHIEEADESLKPRRDFLSLKRAASSKGYPLVESQIRIDAPAGILATGDHVRLKVASLPTNSATAKAYSTDALVESSQHGSATFCCFHPLPTFLEECSWELQSCGSFATTKSMFDAVCNLGTRPDACSISHLILGTEIEHYEINLPTSYKTIKSLNPSQNEAVEAADSHPLTLLWGPPGTGKTHTIVEMIKQLQSSGDRRILVTAPTHNAVDNVMEKYLLGVEGLASQPRPLRVSNDVSTNGFP